MAENPHYTSAVSIVICTIMFDESTKVLRDCPLLAEKGFDDLPSTLGDSIT